MQDNKINKLQYRNLKIVWYNQVTSKEEELLEKTRKSIEYNNNNNDDDDDDDDDDDNNNNNNNNINNNKRPAISLSKMCRSKIFVGQQKLLRTPEIHYKIFNNKHLKFG